MSYKLVPHKRFLDHESIMFYKDQPTSDDIVMHTSKTFCLGLHKTIVQYYNLNIFSLKLCTTTVPCEKTI